MSVKLLYESQYRLREWAAGLRCRLGRTAEIAGTPPPPRKLLFVLSGLIGDSVMCQPTIAEARRQWPEAHISVLGRSHNRDLIAPGSDIDHFHVCDTDPMSLRGAAAVRDLLRWLEGERFDTAAILLGDQYARLLARAAIPVRIGVAGTLMAPCLTHVYDIGSPRVWGRAERLGALRCLGAGVGDARPRMFVDRDAALSAMGKLSDLGLAPDQRYAVLHPFGSTPRQWWPGDVSYFAKELSGHGLCTVLVGKRYDLNGIEVDPLSEPVSSEKVIDTRGQLSLQELVAVIDGASLVVTTDSGPFHIAGALGRNIVGLFRARRPEHAGEYAGAEIVFGTNESCQRECEWDRCKAAPCRQMQEISVEEVLNAAARLMKAQNGVAEV